MNFSYKHRNSHTNNSGLVVFKVYFVADRISDKDLTRTHFVTSTLKIFDIGQTMVALHFIALCAITF